ncbi:MAG: hypothetical protein KAS17_00480 [Victivallaceae bacterium]|nr:hypothetical protein [Victivallaceae bacterium]
MNKKWKLKLVVLGIAMLFADVLSYSGSLNAAESKYGWWNGSFEHRVKLNFGKGMQLEPLKIPVVLSGEKIEELTAKDDILVNTLRIVSLAGKEIPFQIDREAGENGKFLKKQDKLIFIASMTSKRDFERYLYWSDEDKPVANYETNLEYTQKDKLGVFKNSVIDNISFRGTKPQEGKKGKNYYMNGQITKLIYKGTDFINQWASFSQGIPGYYPPHALGTNWDGPVLLSDGPVRKTAGLRSKQYIKKKMFKGREITTCDVSVENRFSVYNECSIIDYEGILRYNVWDKNQFWPTFTLRNLCSPGMSDAKSHLFLIPEEGGKIRKIKYDPEKLKNLKQKITLYSGKPAEGWVALVNEKDRIGILFLLEYEHLRGVHIKKGASLNTAWGNPAIQVLYNLPRMKLKGLGGGKESEYDGFRFQAIRKLGYCLVDLGKGDIEKEIKKYQDIYQWWVNPPQNRVKALFHVEKSTFNN